jgi:hypothetical protein
MAVTFPVIKMKLNNTDISFRDADIINCEVVQETHPISLEIPSGTASVLIYTTNALFSPFAGGYYDSLSRNIPAEIYESIDNVESLIGVFYLDRWLAPAENQVQFDFIDAIGVYANTEYAGSFWSEATAVSTVIAEILNPVGIPYTIAANVGQRTVKGWIPPGKVRDALQQVCFAARCLVSTAKSESVLFTDAKLPISTANESFGYYGEATYGDGTYYNRIAIKTDITDDDKTDKQKLSHLPMVTSVMIKSHDYYHPAEEVQTSEEIYSAYLEPGNYIISYQKPYWKVWADGVGSVPVYISTEDGRVIATEDSGALWTDGRVATESETFIFYSNSMSIQVLEAGQITVYGYAWLDNVMQYRYNELAASTEFIQGFYYGQKIYGQERYSKITYLTATPNAITIEDGTLISGNIAEDVLAKVVEYMKLRYVQNITLLPNPVVTLGDIQVVDSLYGKDIVGITEKLVSNLTGGFLIDAEIVGVERFVN